MSGVRGARLVVAGVVPAELALGICLLAGVRIPAAVLIGAEAAVLAALVLEAVVLGRLWRAGRRAGAGRREAMGAALRTVVPEGVHRLVGHEMRALHSLGLWLLRRRHAVPKGALAAPYTGPQTAMMYGLLFVSVVETVMLALLIPWPVVHRILLVVDVYGVLLVLALHASCVVRPHVVGADGSLRIRYGALFDLRVPAAAIASVRVERRYPEGKSLRLHPDGVLDLAVGGQTTVTVELTAPAGFVRPLGGRGQAHAVRFHADDPRSVVAALTPVRTAPSPSRDLPA
ncbi:hypothetical protein [Streptomyces sp. NBC_01285]|uniref:hypothetical protein n=1 Tax=Streptomyces sp. NBC_01285 TaxID=2903813 RepID=UPI00225AA43C|nr:hypothetical protein [Streptomyces sp. NBC_01285]MCX4772921.1 hypothetical protein [Streptomyces sp. NBC_01285]